eukprot:g6032.t1
MGQRNDKAVQGEVISEGGLIVQRGYTDGVVAGAVVPHRSRYGWGSGARVPTRRQRHKHRGKNNTKLPGQLGYLPGEIRRGTAAEFYARKARDTVSLAADAKQAEYEIYHTPKRWFGEDIDPPKPPGTGQRLLNRALSVNAEVYSPSSPSGAGSRPAVTPGWERHTCPATGRPYWYNLERDESVWEDPSAAV